MPDQITINLTDSIPPINQATIDLNGNTGNTYSKEQLDTKMFEYANSSFVGIATLATVPAVTVPDQTIKYEVLEVGIYTNFLDVNSAPIEILATDFEDNGEFFEVYIYVKEGVSQKVLKPIPSKTQYQSYLDTTTDSPPMTEAEWAVYKGEILDNSVTTEKTNFAISDTFPVGKNILNPAKVVIHKRPHPATGLPFDSSAFDAIFYIPVKSNQPYSFKGLYDVAWFDEDKNLISAGFSSMNATSPVGSAYLSVSYGTGETNQMLQEGTFNPVIYEPFVGISGTKIKSLIFDLLLKDGNKLNIGNTTTNEIRLQGIRQYYQDIPQGTYYGGGAGGANIASVPANTAWGKDALSSVTTGGVNTAFGINALKNLKTGFDNTAFGAGALENFKDGVGNNAFGRLALSKLVNGGHNTALTDSALEKLVAGDDNTCIGYGSGTRIIQGYRNTLYGVYASGWYAGANATQETNYDDTCAFGAQTLTYNISGSKNNTFGNYSMHQLTGEKNCAFGYYSMYNSTNSNNNACFGNNSGGRLVNGNGNVFVGDGSGFILGQKVDASGTTVIGKDTISTRDNEVVIGKNTDTHVTIAGVEFTRAQLIALEGLV